MASKNHPVWMQSAFNDLRRLHSDEIFGYIADNKETLIENTTGDAVKNGFIQDTHEARVAYEGMRRMALVFDMFIALAED